MKVPPYEWAYLFPQGEYIFVSTNEEMNTWPGGYRHALDQDAHERWNASHYPGTRQLCCRCEAPTGRCEEDSINRDDGPICKECAEAEQQSEQPIQ